MVNLATEYKSLTHYTKGTGKHLGVSSTDGVRILQLDEDGEQFELWLHDEARSELEAKLADSITTTDQSGWQAEQILAGMGRVEGPTSGQFLPQDLNYDRIGFVNFRKGCYTGQEIVARLHYRGTPKRRSYPIRIETNTIAAGDGLYTATGTQSVGTIVNATASGSDCVALACIAASALEDELHLGANDGPVLSLLESPYPLADADS